VLLLPLATAALTFAVASPSSGPVSTSAPSSPAAATSSAPVSASAPSAPVDVVDATGERAVNSDDRAAAATTSGVGAFVGTALGGVLVPGLVGLVDNAIGASRADKDGLLVLSAIGGTAGAAVGGAFGAIFTTKPWIGPALVGVASAAGAAAGLVPAIYVAKIPPATLDQNDPVKLAQSACILASLVASSAAGAGAGAWLAAPAPLPEVRKP